MLKYRILQLNVLRRANNEKTFNGKLYKHLHIYINEQLQHIQPIKSHKVNACFSACVALGYPPLCPQKDMFGNGKLVSTISC